MNNGLDIIARSRSKSFRKVIKKIIYNKIKNDFLSISLFYIIDQKVFSKNELIYTPTTKASILGNLIKNSKSKKFRINAFKALFWLYSKISKFLKKARQN